MIIVTEQDMVDFINTQPDDRKVDFDENKEWSTCGCLMVHYGKSKGLHFVSCSINGWLNNKENMVAKFENSLYYSHFIPHRKCTYGEIKTYLNEKEKT